MGANAQAAAPNRQEQRRGPNIRAAPPASQGVWAKSAKGLSAELLHLIEGQEKGKDEGKEDFFKKLPLCRHAFHAHCCDDWLRNNASCPLCRADVPIKKKKLTELVDKAKKQKTSSYTVNAD